MYKAEAIFSDTSTCFTLSKTSKPDRFKNDTKIKSNADVMSLNFLVIKK